MSARVLAVIPARAGSKGLPGKNLADLGGQPLIGWTIAAARGAGCIARVIVSTDGLAIMEAARSLGAEVPFRREDILASDTATTLDVVLDALDRSPGYDYVAVLQPTSPLRTAAHIDAAFAQMQAADAMSVVSVCEAEEPPYWMYRMGPTGRLQQLIAPPAGVTRRQDLPQSFVLNGAIYITATDRLRRTRSFVDAGTIGYPMTRRASVDIDTLADLQTARRYLNEDSHDDLSPAP